MAKVRWSERYDSLFQYWAQVHDVPWRLLKSQAFAESGFNPDAVSSSGAMGLAQFMKGTAADEFEGGQKDPFDPEEAIRAMAKYDAKLYTNVRMMIDVAVEPWLLWRIAVCAYNCGWGYVRRALQLIGSGTGDYTWAEFARILPNAEVKGKRPIVSQTLPYGEKVVPDASVLLP